MLCVLGGGGLQCCVCWEGGFSVVCVRGGSLVHEFNSFVKPTFPLLLIAIKKIGLGPTSQ